MTLPNLDQFRTIVNDQNAQEVKRTLSITTKNYQVFEPFKDPVTIEGLSKRKLNNLNYSNADFEGKTVQDLGCSMGAFSFVALNLGAKSVIGIDKEQSYIDQLKILGSKYQELFPKYRGRIHFERRELINLPIMPASDILMVHSLIHWFFVFNQSVTLEEILDWLFAHANDAVYFEGCVDATEPVMVAHKVDPTRLSTELFLKLAAERFKITRPVQMEYNHQRIALKMYKRS